MDGFARLLDLSNRRLPDDSLPTLVLSLLIAFVLAQAIAWTYTWTHSGLSYSRAFTQSLILLAVVVTLVMFVIGNSLITAFGLIGAMAIIRFRNVLKDTRDTLFVFFVLVLGMATGTQRFATALVGTVVFVLLSLYLHFTYFGSLGRFDGHLSLRLAAAGDRVEMARVLRQFCRSVKPISVRQAGAEERAEYLFEVRLRDRGLRQDLLDQLRASEGVSDVSLMLHDRLSEV
jgi:hypothetical protein